MPWPALRLDVQIVLAGMDGLDASYGVPGKATRVTDYCGIKPDLVRTYVIPHQPSRDGSFRASSLPVGLFPAFIVPWPR
jgi:hypothetical protein